MDATTLGTNSEDGAFSKFLSLYPSYKDTMGIDTLRHKEYPHLDEEGHVCLDYTGVGLFSSSQRSPELYGGFGIGLSHTSANLATHAMYMEGGSTESFFRKRILKYLNFNEDDYHIVFTANAFSAFKLLGQSYPFHEAQSLLRAYDHECENLEALGECAHAKGGLVQSVNLLNPWMKIDRDDLQKKLQGKKKASNQKVTRKGLFAYPYTSRVTGCINSSQWIAEAQQNGWHVLLDVTSVDAKFSGSLGLALFLPDFLIGSFYYVFGEDPTGFGCLVIKQTVLRILGDSSRARAIGMVKIVTRQTSSSSPDESPPESSGRIMDPPLQHFRESPGHRRSLSMHGLSFVADSAADSTTTKGTSSLVQDDSKCFKASIRHKKETAVAPFSMRTLGLSRMHMDALLSVELATPNESIRSASSGVESSKDNFAYDMTRVSCDFEIGSQSMAIMSASLHDVSREIEEIQPVHSHGHVLIGSNKAVRKLADKELQQRQYGYGDDTEHGSLKRSSKHETVSEKRPLQKASGIKSSEEFFRTECASQSAGRSKLTEEVISQDSQQVASVSIQSSVLSSFESGTSKTSTKPPKSAGRSKIPHASMDIDFTCRGLDHADLLGFQRITIRLRALANWLISSLSILRHPQPGNAKLVRIYSQMSIADRGSIIAFTVVDSMGKVFHPQRVQVLADRSSISLRTGTIAGTLSSEMQDAEDEPRDIGCVELSHYKWRTKGEAMLNVHVPVVYVSLGFLNNFSDVYKLWLFISRFLDPDFVSQELWHYHALNQETIAI